MIEKYFLDFLRIGTMIKKWRVSALFAVVYGGTAMESIPAMMGVQYLNKQLRVRGCGIYELRIIDFGFKTTEGNI